MYKTIYLQNLKKDIEKYVENISYMSLDARKPVFGGLRTTSAQSDQRLCYSLFGKYVMLTCYG